MYDNRMTVDVSVKCIECSRTCVTEIGLGRLQNGMPVFNGEDLRVPVGWVLRAVEGLQTGAPRRVLVCPICSAEAA